MDILLTNEARIEFQHHIKDLVHSFLKNRLRLFPKETLKYKHHQFLHYADLLPTVGPLILLSCMRFEAKHQFFVSYAEIMKNHKNVTLSLARKHQMMSGFRYAKGDVPTVKIVCGKMKEQAVENLESFCQFKDILSLPPKTVLYSMKHIDIDNYHYVINSFIIIETDELEPTFAKILDILKIKNDYVFLAERWNTIGFRRHVHAYSICRSENDYCLVKYQENVPLSRPLYANVFSGDGKMYILNFT